MNKLSKSKRLKGKGVVVARFVGEAIGATASCGYRPGTVYTLKTWLEDNCICISRLNGRGRCVYSSLETFNQEWEVQNADQV